MQRGWTHGCERRRKWLPANQLIGRQESWAGRDWCSNILAHGKHSFRLTCRYKEGVCNTVFNDENAKLPILELIKICKLDCRNARTTQSTLIRMPFNCISSVRGLCNCRSVSIGQLSVPEAVDVSRADCKELLWCFKWRLLVAICPIGCLLLDAIMVINGGSAIHFIIGLSHMATGLVTANSRREWSDIMVLSDCAVLALCVWVCTSGNLYLLTNF